MADKIRFRQAIHIEGKCIEDIFCLSCIRLIHKRKDSYFYQLLNGKIANIGDYLCEDTNGRWFVLNPKQYKDYCHDYIDK